MGNSSGSTKELNWSEAVARLARERTLACAEREAFSRSVQALVPAQQEGEKGWVGCVKDAVGPLVDAIKVIWLRSRDDNALMRKIIETQLEAMAWAEFASIKPNP